MTHYSELKTALISGSAPNVGAAELDSMTVASRPLLILGTYMLAMEMADLVRESCRPHRVRKP